MKYQTSDSIFFVKYALIELGSFILNKSNFQINANDCSLLIDRICKKKMLTNSNLQSKII